MTTERSIIQQFLARTQIKSEIADGIVSGLNPGITLTEAWVEFASSMIEMIAGVVAALTPLSRRAGFATFLCPFIGDRAARWIAYRLPDWIVLRLPQGWVSLC